MNIEDLAQLASDEPATLLWCGGEKFAADALGPGATSDGSTTP